MGEKRSDDGSMVVEGGGGGLEEGLEGGRVIGGGRGYGEERGFGGRREGEDDEWGSKINRWKYERKK